MDDEAGPKKRDVLFVHGPTEDGAGARVIRSREGAIEVGELRAVKEGAPLMGGDVVKLEPRPESPRLFNVDVQYRVESTPGHAGPARVSSAVYRRNWDAVFGAGQDAPCAEEDAALN